MSEGANAENLTFKMEKVVPVKETVVIQASERIKELRPETSRQISLDLDNSLQYCTF